MMANSLASKAVVLLSGGLDSTTVLAQAKADGHEVYAISFDYGQRHRIELTAARLIAQKMGVNEHKTVSISLGDLGGSALTDHSLAVPDQIQSGVPITYVPARNTIFLSIALGWAEVLGATDIYVGVSAVDYSGYPDCRPEYIAAFEHLATLATQRGVEGQPIRIQTPLIHLSKAETIQLGLKLGVDYRATVSCYQANAQGEACGRCDSCRLRRQGFLAANQADPTLYRHAGEAS